MRWWRFHSNQTRPPHCSVRQGSTSRLCRMRVAGRRCGNSSRCSRPFLEERSNSNTTILAEILTLTRDRPTFEDVTLRFAPVTDLDAPLKFTLHQPSCELALDLVERITRVCGPFVFMSIDLKVPVLVSPGASLTEVAERALALPRWPNGTSGPSALENHFAAHWLRGLAQEGIEGLRFALRRVVENGEDRMLTFDHGSRAVAAAELVAAVLSRNSQRLTTTYGGLELVVRYITEKERELARSALERVRAERSELCIDWTRRSEGPAWNAEVRRILGLLAASPPESLKWSDYTSMIYAIKKAPPTSQLFFAMWCQDALWSLFGEALKKKVGAAAWWAIEEQRRRLWAQALGAPSSHVDELAGIDWDELDFDDAIESDCGLMLLIGAFQASLGSEMMEAATSSGEAVVESMLHHLNLNGAEDRHLTSRFVLAEIERQVVMVDRLLEGPPAPSMKHTGRESSLFEVDE